MKGNIIGVRNTPSSFSTTSGVWSLQESLNAAREGNWPGSVSPDSYLSNTMVAVKTIGLPGAHNNSFIDSGPKSLPVTRSGVAGVAQGTHSPFQPSGYWSLYHDATNCYTANTASLKMGAGDYTWECWVYWRTQNPNSSYALYSDRTGDNYNGLTIALYEGKLGVRASFDGSTWAVNTYGQGNAIPGDGWTHLAVTRSGNAWRGFVNGGLQWTATTATVGTVQQTGNHYLFKDPGNTVVAFNSYGWQWASNYRIVVGTALYTADFQPSKAPLSAVPGTALLCCQDNNWIQNNSSSGVALNRSSSFSGYTSLFSPFYARNTPRVNQAGSILYNGSGGVTTPNNAALNMGTGDFTWEYWWKPTSFTSCYHIAKGDWTTGFLLYVSNANFYLYVNGGYVAYGNFNAASLGSWNHVALVRYNGVVTFYLNGVNVGSAAYTGNVDNTSPLGIGGYSTGGQTLTGYISNFRAVKGTAVYTGNFTPPTSFLTAIAGTSLLTAQSTTTITDNSPNKLALTVTSPTAAAGEGFLKRAVFPYGGSVTIQGTDNFPTYLTVANDASLQMGTGNFTIDFWYMGISGGSNYPVFQKGTSTGSMSFNNSGFYINSSRIISLSGVVVGIWNHIAIVRDGTTVTLYVNGVSVGTATSSVDLNATGPLNIGYDDNGSISYPATRYGPNALANFRIVKGTAVYTGNFTPPTAPTTAISGTSLLLNFDNAAVYDSSGNATIDTINDAKGGTVAKYNGGTVFDGGAYDPQIGATVDYLSVYHPYRIAGGYAKPNMTIGYSDFTVEAWVRMTSMTSPASQAIFDFGWMFAYGSRGNYPYLYTNYNANTAPGATLIYNDGKQDIITGTSAMFYGTWNHVAVCRSSYYTRLFLNGVQQGDAKYDYANYVTNYTYGVTNHINIGATYALGQPFNGHIEDFRFTYGARYTENFTPPTAPIA